MSGSAGLVHAIPHFLSGGIHRSRGCALVLPLVGLLGYEVNHFGRAGAHRGVDLEHFTRGKNQPIKGHAVMPRRREVAARIRTR